MKYFALKELLIAVPSALVLGMVFAVLHTLLSGVLRGSADVFNFSKPKPKFILKFGIFSEAESKKSKLSERVNFVLSETSNFICLIIYALVFTVFLYIISDGIFRGYVFVFAAASFILTSKLCGKPLDFICNFLSNAVRISLMTLICFLTYFPIKLHKKVKKRKKYTKMSKKKQRLG